ncbi:MAG: M48 family metalloprotease [Nitrospinaceae bacterium]|jgi:predicted Zn-dependent protease|nr:M48 family metalloprotease [Nitrospinaceae bacterium]
MPRKPQRFKAPYFFTAVVLLVLLVTVSVVYSVPFISKETELSMGRSADKEVVQQYGIYQDKALQLYVNQLGQTLVSKLVNKEFSKFFFKLVDSSDINAFALPGGYIYVTRGLLAALNSEAELASVIGHEIGHVTLHHGAKMMIRSIGAQILSFGGAIASPKNAGQWLAVSSAMFQQINMGYGREAELESDAIGMMNATDAGYQPIGMVNFLRNLRNQEIMSGQAYHSFQASHPETKERIVKAGLMASSLSRNNSHLKDNQNSYLSRLHGLVYGGKKHARDNRRYKPKHLVIYRVQKGDTLESIAVKEMGDKRHALEIAVINGRKENTPLKPDISLKIIKEGSYVKDKSLHLSPDPAS